jgi:integral membrane protein
MATDVARPLLADPARRFRLVAVLEAFSWAGLLIGMFFKYVVVKNEIGVQVFGPIHGAIFVAYLLATVTAYRPLRWSPATLLLALVASVPPFFSLIFERWATRTGRLPA